MVVTMGFGSKLPVAVICGTLVKATAPPLNVTVYLVPPGITEEVTVVLPRPMLLSASSEALTVAGSEPAGITLVVCPLKESVKPIEAASTSTV